MPEMGRQQWSEAWSAQLMGECHWAVAVPVDAPELGQQTVAGPLWQQLLVRLLAELFVAALLRWLLQPALLPPRQQQLPVDAFAPLCPLAPLALMLLQQVCPCQNFLKTAAASLAVVDCTLGATVPVLPVGLGQVATQTPMTPETVGCTGGSTVGSTDAETGAKTARTLALAGTAFTSIGETTDVARILFSPTMGGGFLNGAGALLNLLPLTALALPALPVPVPVSTTCNARNGNQRSGK